MSTPSASRHVRGHRAQRHAVPAVQPARAVPVRPPDHRGRGGARRELAATPRLMGTRVTGRSPSSRVSRARRTRNESRRSSLPRTRATPMASGPARRTSRAGPTPAGPWETFCGRLTSTSSTGRRTWAGSSMCWRSARTSTPSPSGRSRSGERPTASPTGGSCVRARPTTTACSGGDRATPTPGTGRRLSSTRTGETHAPPAGWTPRDEPSRHRHVPLLAALPVPGRREGRVLLQLGRRRGMVSGGRRAAWLNDSYLEAAASLSGAQRVALPQLAGALPRRPSARGRAVVRRRRRRPRRRRAAADGRRVPPAGVSVLRRRPARTRVGRTTGASAAPAALERRTRRPPAGGPVHEGLRENVRILWFTEWQPPAVRRHLGLPAEPGPQAWVDSLATKLSGRPDVELTIATPGAAFAPFTDGGVRFVGLPSASRRPAPPGRGALAASPATR